MGNAGQFTTFIVKVPQPILFKQHVSQYYCPSFSGDKWKCTVCLGGFQPLMFLTLERYVWILEIRSTIFRIVRFLFAQKSNLFCSIGFNEKAKCLSHISFFDTVLLNWESTKPRLCSKCALFKTSCQMLRVLSQLSSLESSLPHLRAFQWGTVWPCT